MREEQRSRYFTAAAGSGGTGCNFDTHSHNILCAASSIRDDASGGIWLGPLVETR